MFVKNALLILCASLLTLAHSSAVLAQTAPYPPSPVITGITFDMTTLREEANGSDNWAITWCADGTQHTEWGDGRGFALDDRVSMGTAVVTGDKDNYVCTDTNDTQWIDPDENGDDGGKSYGIVCLTNTLYLFRCGAGGGASASFDLQDIWKSTNGGVDWALLSPSWVQSDFAGHAESIHRRGFFCPTYLQFGAGYAGARDEYVYIYAPENTLDEHNAQIPGRITLMRVTPANIENKSDYEYFAGLDGGGLPTWTSDVDQRDWAFEDPINGVQRTSVSYNAPLGRYILITQQVSRFETENYHIGIYDAPEPWGPWTTIFFGNPKTDIQPSLNSGHKTVFWNLSNKWLSADGKEFVMVYTGDGADNWGTVEGRFITAGTTPTDPPSIPTDLQVE